jgi:hypothetical protein
MAAAQPGIQIAESNSSNERQPGVGMDPVLEAKLDEAAAAYKKLATCGYRQPRRQFRQDAGGSPGQ